MSFTTLGAVHAFDPGVLPGPVAAAVWRGVDMVGAVARTVPTGFGALDAQLPGGGWPTQAVTELLLPQALRCEWRLLGPALPALLQDSSIPETKINQLKLAGYAGFGVSCYF